MLCSQQISFFQQVQIADKIIDINKRNLNREIIRVLQKWAAIDNSFVNIINVQIKTLENIVQVTL